jgi:predicted TIM-barrel fold metal-dependent hydrolase
VTGRILLLHALMLAVLVVASCAGPQGVTPTLPPLVRDATETPKPAPSPQPLGESVATLTVSVSDSASGEPVAGARVVAFQVDVAYVGTRFSDASGRAAFTDLNGTGTTLVTVEAAGYARFSQYVEIVEGDNVVEASLTPESGPTGTVAQTSAVPSRWIDAHCHLAPDACAGGLCGADLIVKSMDEAGVDMVVLFSLDDGLSADVIEAAQRYPGRIVPIRARDGLDLEDPSCLDLYRRDLETGLFHGVGEIRTRHGWYGSDDPPNHPVLMGLSALAGEFDVPALVHMGTRPAGEDQAALPAEWVADWERTLEQSPSTTFIWAHSGPSRPEVLRGLLERHPNLYADLSALNPVFFEVRGRAVPPELMIDGLEWIRLLEDQSERFLFGTDNYTAEAYLGTADLVAYVRDEVFPQLSPEAVEAIAHGNAERLYGIPPAP